MEVTEHEVEVCGARVFFRRVEGEGTPTLFVHGNPTHSEDWLPFLERMSTPALAPDLPGWGRSGKPPLDRFDYSMHGLARLVGEFLDVLEVEDHSLVVHDWGVVGLIAAQAHPRRLKRLVLLNAVPLVPGYRWHWVARWFWRRRVLGELFNAAATRSALKLISREATPRPGPMPPEFLDGVWRRWPRGFWREMLTLYRSADPDALAAAGGELGAIDCPALILWPRQDPYLPVRFGRAYAERLAGAELAEIDDAGHWPWIDRPELVDRVVGFLESS